MSRSPRWADIWSRRRERRTNRKMMVDTLSGRLIADDDD